ncbi:hypothetical protein EVJ22_13445 [Exiguobacterium sp. SH0S7]|uniref:hypothetical protein n=1 Tax=Exiguobacterium sp. SH0S7 TaxID=2510951 RepID=UPI00103F05A8|nr:hypothetical protein [Exiguobacterium sp. SH0S7]TCI67857.1 hypothetical protein EVJ22_13445 [Exiguobacterium sp. SH0S7]
MKKILFVATLFLFMLNPVLSANASTFEEAVELPRNDSTSFVIPEKNDLTTINNNDDVRTYKVFLGMNQTEKLTLISQKTYAVEIYDAQGITLAKREKVGEEGNRQLTFETASTGWYYVEINPSDTDFKTDYPYSLRVIVGEPLYVNNINPYTVNLGSSSITSTSNASRIQYFDLSNEASIPDDAILTSVTIGGSESNRYLLDLYSIKRSIRPSSTVSWIHTGFPLYDASNLDYVAKSSQIRMKQFYSFQHSARLNSSGTYTLSPTIWMYYKKELK